MPSPLDSHMVTQRPVTAAVTSAGCAQPRNETPQKSESRYRSLFNHIDSGFCIVEVAFDDLGRARDYRFLEVNPAFERLTGLPNAAGKWMRELVPAHEQRWYDTYGRIAKTGVPERFENLAAALDRRWYDVHAFRIDEPEAHRVAILFNDITDRKRTEQSLQTLNESLEQLVRERTKERDRIWQVSQDLLGIADADGVWLSVNPRLRRRSAGRQPTSSAVPRRGSLTPTTKKKSAMSCAACALEGSPGRSRRDCAPRTASTTC